MIHLFKRLLGIGTAIDYKQMLLNGAVIIDVRTKPEYSLGHINGSLNIPLDGLNGSISKLKKDKVVITCCASGMRSASAKNILKSNGFSEVYNGGSWISLQQKIG